jgi:hypothetical protein
MGCITSRKEWRPAVSCLGQGNDKVPHWFRGLTRSPVELAVSMVNYDRRIVHADRWRKWAPLYDEYEVDELMSVGIDVREGW